MRTLAALLLLLAACAAPPRAFDPPSADAYEDAVLPGFRAIRFWADEAPPFLDSYLESRRGILKANPSLSMRQDILALSGGAEDGAYGAGFLKGWSERGDRPEFTWVTGISTGALIAPFAFLGSDYDDDLQRFFTGISVEDIVNLRPLGVLFGGSAVGDTAPLRETVEATVDDEMVAAIARESRRGRYLMIGTTHLDAQRHMIWNIGAIAESGKSDAKPLIHDILLASASIPGAFPPVLFDVTVDGARHQELHVDGGITHQVFAYPPAIHLREIDERLGVSPRRTLWVVRNTKIEADYQPVDLGAANIVTRAINTLTKYQGRGDLLALESLAARDGMALRVTYVPASFDMPYEALFDPDYMGALYRVGYAAALGPEPWQESVSGLVLGDESATLHFGDLIQ